MKSTTIRIFKTTRDELAKFGEKDDSFDDIIKKLMKKAKEA